MKYQRRKFSRLNGSTSKSIRGRLKEVYEKMKTLENWRKTVLLACVVALAIDPLFLLIPVIDSHRSCLTFDKKLGIAVSVLRTFIDAFYVFHIIFHFITSFIAPRTQVSWRGESIVNSKALRKKGLLFYFIVDILSVLPIPQVVVLNQLSATLVTEKILKWIIISQFVPRYIRSYPIFKEVTRASGNVTESKWIGAAINFFMYMLFSYVFGAFWYVNAIEKQSKCWHDACARSRSGCNLTDLFCRRGGGDNSRFLNTTCPLIDPSEITKNSTVFNFGMYTDALRSGVLDVGPRDFPRKFVYCFWWGLRNISALGQNLETSNSAGENFFAVIICVSGLLLFAVLIGNVQKYLQSSTTRVDEMEEKRRDTEIWMSYRKLPEGLKESIRKYGDYKWRETRGTEEEALLRSLPKHLRKDIKRHLCLNLLKRVPWLQAMDDQLLDILCSRLKTAHYTVGSYIAREGEPVEDMLLIKRGNLISTTTYGDKTGFSDSVNLTAGDFCGDLLTWAMDPQSSHFPISSRTVQALTEVEGFLLSADDIKFVANQYRHLHSKELQHLFRYYSVEWQRWAACFIQAAWRRHCRRKHSKALREEESKLHNPLLNDDSRGNKLNLGAAIYASRFASHALRNLRANAASQNSRFPQMLSLLPQKPADPEFPVDET